MIWDETHVYDAVSASAWVMGFNEPDLTGQAGMTPQAAVKYWRIVESRFPERKLVAPAPSHLHLEWLPQFRAVYRAEVGRYPRFDALAVHCYDSAAQCIAVVKQFEAWAREWGVPEIWVTEFAFVPAWSQDAEGEARAFMAYLGQRPMVTRVAPFLSYGSGCDEYWPDCRPDANPALLHADLMTPTDIGRWYARPLEHW